MHEELFWAIKPYESINQSKYHWCSTCVNQNYPSYEKKVCKTKIAQREYLHVTNVCYIILLV
jgi:hypothetical protein